MAESPFDRRRYPDGFAFGDWLAADGWRHRAFRWAATGEPRGSLIFQAGRADYAEKYLETYAHFHARGWAVEGFDWRGQGGSGRADPVWPADDRASFDPLVGDLVAFVVDWRRRTPAPHVLVAHSMGAYVALLALAQGMTIDAAVLTSPMFALRTGRLPRGMARALVRAEIALGRGRRAAWKDRRIEPARQLRLTADRDRYEDAGWWARAVPGLESGVPSWRWLAAGFAAPERLAAAALERIATPLLLLVPGRDPLVDARAADIVARRLPDARITHFADSRHELLRETDARRFAALAAIDAFLESRAPA